MKSAFVHLMKAAGTTVNSTLTRFLWPRGYQIMNSWETKEGDWSAEELHGFLGEDSDSIYVHNHAANWPAETLQAYLNANWFLFSFFRHPGDQWCSFYYWATEANGPDFPTIARNFSLNEFLFRGWTEDSNSEYDEAFQSLRQNLDLPSCWRQFQFVANFSNDTFQQLLRDYFGCRQTQKFKRNQSANRGYEYYRKSGAISDETHRLLVASRRFDDFQSLEKGVWRNDDEPFRVSKRRSFLRLGRASKKDLPARYLILQEGRGLGIPLTARLAEHPWIAAFGDEIAAIPHRTVAQQGWLRFFYVRFSKKEKGLCLGNQVGHWTIIDPVRFAAFIEKHQVHVIRLHDPDPVNRAVAALIGRQRSPIRGKNVKLLVGRPWQPLTLEPNAFRESLKNDGDGWDAVFSQLQTPKMELTCEAFDSDFEKTAKCVFRFLKVRDLVVKNIDGGDIWNPLDFVANWEELQEIVAERPV